jgi:outer membrane protein
MNMRIQKFIFLLLLLGTSGLYAQNSRKLTLEEAINLAVANSKQLQLSESKVKEAQARVAQAKDRAWPEVKISGTYLHINTPQVSMSGAQDNPAGGSSGGNSLASTFSRLHDIGLAQVSVSEPIFSGFRIRNNRVMEEYLAEAAKYDATTAKSKVITNTARAIFQYYELLETQRAVEKNLKQAQQRVTEFKNLEAQSLLAKNDRLKAELQANNIELTRTEVKNNVALAAYNLVLLLGLPDETTLELDTTQLFKNPPLATWEQYLQKGIENRSELNATRMQVQAGEAGYKIAKANRYPTLALTGGYVNAYIPNVFTVTNALNAGLSLQYNLTGAIHGRHTMQEAKARQHQAELSQQLTTDQVKLDIREKFLNYQKSLEKIAVTQRAIEQATENFTITKNKYDAGLVILSDYLDADVTLLQTQINHATARADSMIAYYELQESTGTNQQ